MAIYSHSRLSTYEQCPQKYKFKYIDKTEPDFEKSIESHLGKCVHDALEWLYKEVLKGRTPALDEVIERYTNTWQKNYKETFLIVRKECQPEDYFNKGIKFLVEYYLKNYPFKDGTIAVEKELIINLHKDSEHKIIGYVDRLVYNKERDEYEIHDYKTGNTIPDRAKFELDRQLGIYGLGIKQLFGYDKRILLVWHYLDHNLKVYSQRTDLQYEQLKKEILNLIHEVEKTTVFPTNKSSLCDWCEFKSKCPAWN